jgi:hypothetical protein
MSISGGLLHCEASRARVFQFCYKIGEGVTTSAACGIIMELRESEAKDGRFDGIGCNEAKIRRNNPSLAVISLLAHMGIVVFYFCYK